MTTRSSRVAGGALSLVGLTALTVLGRRAEAVASSQGDDLVMAAVPAATDTTRPRRRHSGRLVVVGLATATAALAGTSGVAWAYIHGASGFGSGNATAAAAQTVTAVSASLLGSLYPGGTSDLTVTITNPYNLTMTVKGASIVSVSETGGTGGCSNSTTGLTAVTPSSIDNGSIAANTAQAVTLHGVIKMSNSSDTGCQGASFQVTLTVTTQVG